MQSNSRLWLIFNIQTNSHHKWDFFSNWESIQHRLQKIKAGRVTCENLPKRLVSSKTLFASVFSKTPIKMFPIASKASTFWVSLIWLLWFPSVLGSKILIAFKIVSAGWSFCRNSKICGGLKNLILYCKHFWNIFNPHLWNHMKYQFFFYLHNIRYFGVSLIRKLMRFYHENPTYFNRNYSMKRNIWNPEWTQFRCIHVNFSFEVSSLAVHRMNFILYKNAKLIFVRTSLLVKFLGQNKNIFCADIFENTVHFMNFLNIVVTQILKCYVSTREKVGIANFLHFRLK